MHLSTGLLWSWRLGPGTAAEQVHLRRLLGTLSRQALIVCDAAYMGYDLVQAIVGTGRSFLFRLSSRVDLYTLEAATLAEWTEGPVLYWPKYVQEAGLAPISCRLIRVPAKGRRQGKHDVWLLTDVLDPARLTAATAAKFYRWRWRNEGMFRIYKRTINKMKLASRTVASVHREAELSLLATQVLLAHADLALRPDAKATADEPAASPRQVLIEIRREMTGLANRRSRSYSDRLPIAERGVGSRPVPRRRELAPSQADKPPKPPILRTLNEEQKACYTSTSGPPDDRSVTDVAWHRGKPIDEALTANPHLEFYRLPSYSPQLNVIERFWKVLRQRATHNRLFESLAELKRSLRASLCYYQTMRGGGGA